MLGGGEWALIGPAQYFGLLDMNAAVQRALASGSGTGYGEHALYTNRRLETGDPRYSWVNPTFFIGEGHLLLPRVRYRAN